MKEFNRYTLQVRDAHSEKYLEILKNIEVRDLISRHHISHIEYDFQTARATEEIIKGLVKENSSFYLTLIEEVAPTTDLIKSERILDEALYLINSGEFWRAHVLLEAIWKHEEDLLKRNFFRGLILLCASQVKEQMNQREVALKMYSKAIKLVAQKFPEGVKQDIAPEHYSYPLRVNSLAVRQLLP